MAKAHSNISRSITILADERDYRLMVMLHTLRDDYPITRRLKVVRSHV